MYIFFSPLTSIIGLYPHLNSSMSGIDFNNKIGINLKSSNSIMNKLIIYPFKRTCLAARKKFAYGRVAQG